MCHVDEDASEDADEDADENADEDIDEDVDEVVNEDVDVDGIEFEKFVRKAEKQMHLKSNRQG